MLSSCRCLALSITLLLPSTVVAEPHDRRPVTVNDLEQTLDDYLAGMANLRTTTEVTKLIRVSNGRLTEKTYMVECLIGNGVARISHYSAGVVDGTKKFYDISEALLFPSEDTAEWRHPGFPGQISFGKDSTQAHNMGFSASQLGHPLFHLRKIRRVLSREASVVTSESDDCIIVRTSPLHKAGTGNAEDDYVEIVFDERYGRLPVSMTRVFSLDDPDRYFQSGGNIRIDYKVRDSGTVVPLSVQRDRRLKDDVEGILNTNWVFTTFDPDARPTVEQLKLILPIQVLAEDVDSGRRFIVTGTKDESAMTLKQRYGDYVEFEPREAAMRSIAESFVGQCPDLPPEYHLANRQPPKPAEIPTLTSSSTWRLGMLLTHAIGLWTVGVFWRRAQAAVSRTTDS